jgi:hydrogenase maturation protein HypF
VQCAAGFLAQLDHLPDMKAAPFHFPARYEQARMLVSKRVRTFETTSMGRLFDTAAALLGFTRETSFEGQAAMWLEHLARAASNTDSYLFPIDGEDLDFRPLLTAVLRDRLAGRDPAEIARAFQRGVAQGLCDAVQRLGSGLVVLSGGVFQNDLLLSDIKGANLNVWTNSTVPTNDGGISLGQAALAVFHA